MSLPVTSPCADRPSAKRTCVVRSRRLWAFVTTRFGATTNPEPRPWRPMLTTDGVAPADVVRTACLISSSALMTVSSRVGR